MSHSRDANELLEVVRDELRPIVGDDPRLDVRVFSLARSRIISMSKDKPHHSVEVPPLK